MAVSSARGRRIPSGVVPDRGPSPPADRFQPRPTSSARPCLDATQIGPPEASLDDYLRRTRLRPAHRDPRRPRPWSLTAVPAQPRSTRASMHNLTATQTTAQTPAFRCRKTVTRVKTERHPVGWRADPRERLKLGIFLLSFTRPYETQRFDHEDSARHESAQMFLVARWHTADTIASSPSGIVAGWLRRRAHPPPRGRAAPHHFVNTTEITEFIVYAETSYAGRPTLGGRPMVDQALLGSYQAFTILGPYRRNHLVRPRHHRHRTDP